MKGALVPFKGCVVMICALSTVIFRLAEGEVSFLKEVVSKWGFSIFGGVKMKLKTTEIFRVKWVVRLRSKKDVVSIFFIVLTLLFFCFEL